MASYRRVAAALLVLGAALLANPLYLGPVLETTSGPTKVPRVYAADPVDPNTSAGREQLVDSFAPRLAFFTLHLWGDSDDDYRAPNATARVLRRAALEGSARVANESVRADLREIRRDYRYYRLADAEDVPQIERTPTPSPTPTEAPTPTETSSAAETTPTESNGVDHSAKIYRFRLVDRANGTVVRADRANDSELLDAVMARYLIRYDRLNEGQQRTFDRILNQSSGGGYSGYRPYEDESLHERLPAVVLKEGTYYHVHAVGHVDDFGPGFFFFVVLSLAGAALALLGLLIALGGRLLTARSSGDDPTRQQD